MPPRNPVQRQQRAIAVRGGARCKCRIGGSLKSIGRTSTEELSRCTSVRAVYQHQQVAAPETQAGTDVSLALANNQPGLSLWDTLPRNNSYDTSDMIEIGYIWKHIGIRGEVAIRIRTSFQDMRVGLAGPRYLMPTDSQSIGLPDDPLQTMPPLHHIHQRLARQKLQAGKTVWIALFDGCFDRAAAEQLRYARVFMHRDDCPRLDSSSSTAAPSQNSPAPASVPREAAEPGVPPPTQRPLPHSTVPLEALRFLSAEEVRGFEAHLTAPDAAARGGVRRGDPAEGALARPGGAVCVGRVMDVLVDEGRFYDTGEHVRARGTVDLPGVCPVFRVAFRRGLVAAPLGGFASVDALPRDELLAAEGTQELREHGRLSNGATPLWMPNARSGLLPLLPQHILHIDGAAETILFSAPQSWLKDHLAPRMVKRRPPRRTDKAKASMGDKLRKRRDKAFIRRKGKFARKGRNMRKT